MASYSPAQVAGLAGVSATRIESLARELVASHPAVVVVDEETKDSTATGAALVLQAVLSSLGRPGGMLLDAEEPGFALASERAPALAGPGLQMPAVDAPIDGRATGEASRILAVPEAILSGKPYPVEVLLLHYSNPAFSKPDGKRWAEAIAKVPFVVSFSPILDESAQWADLLLPDQTFLERWDVVAPARATGVVSLRQPVVRPLTQAMQTGEVLLRLAAALGGTVAASLPWKTHHDAVVAGMEARGAETEDVLERLADKGVCKMADERAAIAVALLDVTPALPGKATTPAGDPLQFPFVLCPFRDRGHGEGGFREFPWLAELPGPAADPGSGYVEIAGEDARKLAVEDGEWVAVTSPAGRVELRTRIHPHIKAGVLGLRLGGWGRVVGNSDGTPTRLLIGATDAAGHWQAFATRAKVEKLG
jgi:anaerobic selenocysteine-containing dehydrogenase